MVDQDMIPAVELRHLLDPLDTDDGPLQRLAPGHPGHRVEQTREDGHTAASRAVSDVPVRGYPLAV